MEKSVVVGDFVFGVRVLPFFLSFFFFSFFLCTGNGLIREEEEMCGYISLITHKAAVTHLKDSSQLFFLIDRKSVV